MNKNRSRSRSNVYRLIDEERQRQIGKWGDGGLDPFVWIAVLSEELGEASEAILKQKSQEDLEGEIVQIAAVAVAWLEDCNRHREKDVENA